MDLEQERKTFRSYGLVKKINDPRRPRKKKQRFGLSELIELDHHVDGITGVPNLTNEGVHIVDAVRGTKPSKKARRRWIEWYLNELLGLMGAFFLDSPRNMFFMNIPFHRAWDSYAAFMFVNSDTQLLEMAEGLELDNRRWQALVTYQGNLQKRQITLTNATKNPRYQLIILRPTALLVGPNAAFIATGDQDQPPFLYATSSDGTIRQVVGQVSYPFGFTEAATGPPPLQNFNHMAHRSTTQKLDPYLLVINANEKICSCEDLQVPLPPTSSTTVSLVKRIIDLLLWRPIDPMTDCRIETDDPKIVFSRFLNDIGREDKPVAQRSRSFPTPTDRVRTPLPGEDASYDAIGMGNTEKESGEEDPRANAEPVATFSATDWSDSDDDDSDDDDEEGNFNRYPPLSESELLTYAQTCGDYSRSSEERAAALHGIMNGRAYAKASKFNTPEDLSLGSRS
ncbi:hypothetical protein T439DRAFT_375994 [Meredithblackwellia eburnea MCA 4105]